MPAVDVDPSVLFGAARTLYAGAPGSWFDDAVSADVGSQLDLACRAFADRVRSGGISRELVGLARGLELSSGRYLHSDAEVVAMVTGHAG
jgi:hypothetical protein